MRSRGLSGRPSASSGGRDLASLSRGNYFSSVIGKQKPWMRRSVDMIGSEWRVLSRSYKLFLSNYIVFRPEPAYPLSYILFPDTSCDCPRLPRLRIHHAADPKPSSRP